MILRIFFFLLYTVLVSSNNGSPIIPAQTYPIYQQNVYANPSNQPSDITPYLQNKIVQNQSPTPNLSPSNIRQMLLNKLLSNQHLQGIIDQNSGGYGSNLVGYPNNPIATNAGNVYFGAPVFEDYQTPSGNKENKPTDVNPQEKRKKHKRRKSSKSRRKHNESESKITSNYSTSDQINATEDNNKEVIKKTKKHSRKQNNESLTQDDSIKQTQNENRKHSRTKKRKTKENEEKSLADEDTKVENLRPKRRRKKKPKADSNNAEKVIPEQTMPSKKSKVTQEDLNLATFKEGITEENRVARNPKQESNDLLKLIPNLPEGFGTTFNFKGLPQFQNNPSMSNFFANYESIYQGMLSKNQETVDVRKKPKSPRTQSQQKRKPAVKSKNSTTTEATVLSKSNKVPVTPKVNVVTTEKTIYINEKTHTNIDIMPKDKGLKSIDQPPQIEEVTVEVSKVLKNDETVNKNEEIVNENDEETVDLNLSPDPDYSNGYIADYYPLFTDSAVNTANNKEVYIKNLGDTKYYYAVDRGNPDLIGRMRFESFTLPERVTKDYETNKRYENIEKESIKNYKTPDHKEMKEETLQFRTPPQLESPDFLTRKVERLKINTEPYYNFSDDENEDLNHRFVGDKSSIYSEAKTPYYSGSNDNVIKMINDKLNKDIETVFARSKVVKYGPVFNSEEDSLSAGTVSQAATDDSYFKDGGTTYVLAASMDHPEFY